MTNTNSKNLSEHMNAALPTFIILGAMKCGTSSLHWYLSAHPQITVSDPKELEFFNIEKNYARGLPWYASKFDGTYTVRGEASPNYSKSHLTPDVPRRMYSTIPDCKLIYLLRNPVERAISHYLNSWECGQESRSIAEAFQDFDTNDYVQTGRYFYQIEKFLEYYSPEQFLILTSDELRENRQPTLARVFRFLGVDDAFVSPQFDEMRHLTVNKRRQKPYIQHLHKFSYLRKLVRAMLPEPMVRILRNITTMPLPSATIDPDLRARLVKYYQYENQKLALLISGKLPRWL